jgi:prophage regulatory protein
MRSTVRCLRRKAVLEKVGISATQLFNLEKAGDFPAHFMLSPRCAAYLEAEVDAWLEKRAERRGQSAISPRHSFSSGRAP